MVRQGLSRVCQWSVQDLSMVRQGRSTVCLGSVYGLSGSVLVWRPCSGLHSG